MLHGAPGLRGNRAWSRAVWVTEVMGRVTALASWRRIRSTCHRRSRTRWLGPSCRSTASPVPHWILTCSRSTASVTPARPFGPAPHVPGEDGETIPLQVRRQLCRPLGITSMGVRDKYGADRVPWAHLAAPSRGRGLPLTVTLACLKREMALLSDRLRSVPLQNSMYRSRRPSAGSMARAGQGKRVPGEGDGNSAGQQLTLDIRVRGEYGRPAFSGPEESANAWT